MTKRCLWPIALLLYSLMAWGQTDISDLPPFFEGDWLDPEQDETPEEFLNWLLEATVMDVRKSLPERLDAMTWAEEIELNEEHLVYTYRLESLHPEDQDRRYLERRLWPVVLTSICEKEIAHLVFTLGKGVMFRYRLPNGEGDPLELRIHSEHCTGVREWKS